MNTVSDARQEQAVLALLRCCVPMLYVLCLIPLLLDQVESYRRFQLAEEVSRALREQQPQSLSALKLLLGEHCEAIVSNPVPGEEGVSIAHIRLKPRVWLDVVARYATEGETISSVGLVYASSEGVPLDSPSAALPSVPGWQAIFFAGSLAGIFSWVWVRAVRVQMNWKNWLGAAIAAAPVIPFVVLALLSLLRISM